MTSPGKMLDLDGMEALSAALDGSMSDPENRALWAQSVQPADVLALIQTQRELVGAAQRVLDGLNARIEAAVADSGSRSVPVFDGIADLQSALTKALGEQPL